MEVELTRSADDRRRYELAGYGAERWAGRLSSAAELEARDARTYAATFRGWTRQAARVVDAAGNEVGGYRGASWRSHDGAVTWRSVAYEVRKESAWRNHYSLRLLEGPVLRLEARLWGRRPVKVSLVEPGLEPGLVLFAVWLVQTFVSQDASSGG
jgi:hypothetical protein